jgi:hypothetical protein
MSNPFSTTARYTPYYVDQQPAKFPISALSVWLGAAIAVLTIAGAFWKVAATQTAIEITLARVVEVQASQNVATMANAKATSDLAIALGFVQGDLAGRTKALESGYQSNRSAIRAGRVQSESNRAAITRTVIKQDEQTTQLDQDRAAAQVQSSRQDQLANRQSAAETAAATSERIQGERTTANRAEAAKATTIQRDRIDQLGTQLDVDRAAARAKKKK